MKYKYAKEIRDNLLNADKSIRAAKDLLNGRYFDFAASRAYYAAFYASTALLLSQQYVFDKQSAVIATVHEKFIRTEIFDQKLGIDLNWLYELKNVGDYEPTLHLRENDALKAIEAAEGFLSAVNAYLI
jgi:uncharacterized protein (UPF0332 family)